METTSSSGSSLAITRHIEALQTGQMIQDKINIILIYERNMCVSSGGEAKSLSPKSLVAYCTRFPRLTDFAEFSLVDVMLLAGADQYQKSEL